MIDLTSEQKNIINKLWVWFARKESHFITLGGYAGTGKTTLISILRKEIFKKNPKVKVAFIAYTGKASRVLSTKLIEYKAIYKEDVQGTIHSLIYSPIINDKKQITGWQLKDKNDIRYDLIIVDEASMVDNKIWNDLLQFDIPVIAVGDHGQLPPINGNFNLMDNPQLRLEQIHRQAEHNPIINISIQARLHGEIPTGDYSPTVKKILKSEDDAQSIINELLGSYNDSTMVLCGYNNTRIKLNNFIRDSIMGYPAPTPQSGDKVICLRNNHEKQIFNGMLGTISNIEDADDDWYLANIMTDDSPYSGLIYKDQFNAPTAINFTDKRIKTAKGDLFDFGYALTVHKAQGSQSKRVILFEERFSKMDDNDWKRWLYTAVTRAEEELYIIGDN